MTSNSLLASVKQHEGLRLKAYPDSKGIWTIGYGTNLQELEISELLATNWMLTKLEGAEFTARGYTWFDTLSQPRKDVIVEMLYNLGATRFAGFKKLHQALVFQNWENAAAEMQDSDWHKQVGVRAERLAKQMELGEYWL